MRGLAVAVAMLVGGCALLRMQGFDQLAMAGDLIEVRGIPAWRSGDFSVGEGTRGTVRRIAIGETITDDPLFRPFPEIERSVVARHGRFAFRVQGPAVGGRLSGACRYGREEAVARAGGTSIAAPTVPLSLNCTFADDGVLIGRLVLEAAEPGASMSVTARTGEVSVAGVTLGLRSAHRGAGVASAIDQPLGYFFIGGSGRTVGAAELVSSSAARLALPRDAEQRRAAVAAGIALALFWDPGDVD